MEIELRKTCSACPEQYDAFLNGEKVGYLRLRHGHFRVDYPDCGDETIYQANPTGDGCFEEFEREAYLSFAKKAIVKKLYEVGKIEFVDHIHFLEKAVNYSDFVKSLTASHISCRYVCNGTESFVVVYSWSEVMFGQSYQRLDSSTLLEEDLKNYCLLNLVAIDHI